MNTFFNSFSAKYTDNLRWEATVEEMGSLTFVSILKTSFTEAFVEADSQALRSFLTASQICFKANSAVSDVDINWPACFQYHVTTIGSHMSRHGGIVGCGSPSSSLTLQARYVTQFSYRTYIKRSTLGDIFFISFQTGFGLFCAKSHEWSNS